MAFVATAAGRRGRAFAFAVDMLEQRHSDRNRADDEELQGAIRVRAPEQ